MPALELQIAESRRIIADLVPRLRQHRQRVEMLRSQVRRLGLEGEKGEQLRKAFEHELEIEKGLVEQLDGMLGRETDRLWTLEQQLRSLRPPRPKPIQA